MNVKALVFLLLLFCTPSCELPWLATNKQPASRQFFSPQPIPGRTELEVVLLPQYSCAEGGTSLELGFPRGRPAGGVSVLWEIDGGPGGHSERQDCLCARSVRVLVTRLSDGYRTERSLLLDPCDD